jgi:glutamyl-tRNA synthetase
LGGDFILRIEDTDTERSSPVYLQDILDSMKWLELHWDEGPIFQSQRMEVYRQHLKKLQESGCIYPCVCDKDRLERVRTDALQKKEKPRYDGLCRNKTLADIAPGTPYVWRFRMPNDGETEFTDQVKGTVVTANAEMDDLILARSDGTPTYNFCVVVDDGTADITHVIRGDDHLNNTPKQIHLFRALGFSLPEFYHVPMIMGPDKKKLSKRHGAVSVSIYRELGYLPEAMRNYLLRLGWSHGDDEILSTTEMVEKFSRGKLGKAAAVFDFEKLTWLNGHYIRSKDNRTLAALLVQELGEPCDGDYGKIDRLLTLAKERAKTLKELSESVAYYFKNELGFDSSDFKEFLTPNVAQPLTRLRAEIKNLESFDEKNLKEAFHVVLEEIGWKMVQLAQPARVALTGRKVSPGIFEVMTILGRERVDQRLSQAIRAIQDSKN